MARALVYTEYRFALLGVLIIFARARQTLSYSELVAAARLPLNMAGNPIHRNILSQWLFELAKEDDAAGRPILPALVVRSSSGQPGPGFFGMLEELGRRHEGESDADAHSREVNAVYDYYGDRRALVECWIAPARDRDRRVIESRSPKFNLVPVRYPHSSPEFILVHTDDTSEGRAGEFVTPEWFTGTWALLPSIWAYRFLIRGDLTFWTLKSWSALPERRVQIILEPERGVLDVRKVRDYPDGSCAFEVLFSDGAKTWGKVRRKSDHLEFFDVEYHRDGWPEPPMDMVAAALNSTIPG